MKLTYNCLKQENKNQEGNYAPHDIIDDQNNHYYNFKRFSTWPNFIFNLKIQLIGSVKPFFLFIERFPTFYSFSKVNDALFLERRPIY